MRTEASAKFEKGLDILNTLPAVNRACELVELLGAGEVVDGVIDILNYVPNPTVLKLEPEKINALLGTDVSHEEMISILKKLSFEIDETGRITVPSWRGDVKEMADLAEEVARFHSYNNIPVTLMRGQTTWAAIPKPSSWNVHWGCVPYLRIRRDYHIFLHLPTYYDKIRWPENDARRSSFKILNPFGRRHLHHAYHRAPFHAGNPEPQLQLP